MSCLELFSFDRLQRGEDQLDDAVVLQWGQGDHLTGCSDDDPEGRVLEEVHCARALLPA